MLKCNVSLKIGKYLANESKEVSQMSAKKQKSVVWSAYGLCLFSPEKLERRDGRTNLWEMKS